MRSAIVCHRANESGIDGELCPVPKRQAIANDFNLFFSTGPFSGCLGCLSARGKGYSELAAVNLLQSLHSLAGGPSTQPLRPAAVACRWHWHLDPAVAQVCS